tara:strand:+ start:30 stop:476 length:447 start_codon:yes stop_codon:yes gene_type:complete
MRGKKKMAKGGVARMMGGGPVKKTAKMRGGGKVRGMMGGGPVKKTAKMNMGGRTGDMMYSRGYGVGERSKRMPTELMTAQGMKKGGSAKKKTAKKKTAKKKQGFKDRKDESIAMRIKKKRTKKQLKASRNESYGKFGSKARKKGKINR